MGRWVGGGVTNTLDISATTAAPITAPPIAARGLPLIPMEHFAPGIREITPKDKGANYHKRTETDRHFLTRCGTACRVPLSRSASKSAPNHAATSLGLRKSILILVELQLAHWNLWTARSRRVGCGSMAASVISLRHFAQVSFMKRSKDIVGVPQRARGWFTRQSGRMTAPLSKPAVFVRSGRLSSGVIEEA